MEHPADRYSIATFNILCAPFLAAEPTCHRVHCKPCLFPDSFTFLACPIRRHLRSTAWSFGRHCAILLSSRSLRCDGLTGLLLAAPLRCTLQHNIFRVPYPLYPAICDAFNSTAQEHPQKVKHTLIASSICCPCVFNTSSVSPQAASSSRDVGCAAAILSQCACVSTWNKTPSAQPQVPL